MENLPSVETFITKGILPENLPPVFTTKALWSHLHGLGTSYAVTGKAVGELALYNASKRGGQRRIFGLPHPLFSRDISLFIEKHWSQILGIINQSPGSASKPIFMQNRNRHVGITPHSELPRIRLREFSRYKFCLVSDVARFFPSVYTHSIPWAINGKELAKTDNSSASATVFGNKLDYILRSSQSKQTIGIPVGPDSSKIISEIVMSAVDAAFLQKSGNAKPTYVRHVDDYWIAGNTYEECEKHLQNLRLALREFELDINERKTRIVSTRLILGDDWPFEFDNEISETLAVVVPDGNRALAILSKIVERASLTEDDGIIRHAIRKIDEKKLWSRDWELFEHFLAQCAVQFPHSFDYVARVIAWRTRIVKDTNSNLWKDVAILTINQNAALGRDSEVIWALWLLKELQIKLPRKSSDLILLNSGPLVLAFLAHMYARKLTTAKSLKAQLQQKVTGNPISGQFWPLSLELTHLGLGKKDWSEAALTTNLFNLHKLKASIIDWNTKPKVFISPEGDDDGDPEHAIEDYGADYGDEDEDDLSLAAYNQASSDDLIVSLFPNVGSNIKSEGS